MTPETIRRRHWYAEESPGLGWCLNEFVPDGSDGHLATFGAGGEAECKQAAHEHNCHAVLLAALKALMDVQDATDDCWCVEVGNPGTCEACRARQAIAKAEDSTRDA